ncbi:MAG: 3-carboxy-cis,cis-muconate cycloisomerase [Rhodobacteraceae bacterium]|nr:3-carboxy-cis,cis-muconate cycloisomerase [Paracoccaceae bacterium]
MTNAFTASGLFGELFRDPAIAAEFAAPAFLARMCAFEAAWTRALAAAGAVAPGDADAALAAIEGHAAGPDAFAAASLRDGLPVPGLVAALRRGLPPGAAAAIHTGATSQDVIDSAMVLTLLAVAGHLEGRLRALGACIDELSRRFGTRPLTARTRMQAALPATVELRLAAWRRPLADHLARLAGLRTEIGRAQIGGAVGLRDAPEGRAAEVAEAAARALGLALGPVWHTDRSPMVAFGHWLTLVAGTAGKIGQDVALMAQQGLDEIALAGGGGSSAMPHKQNPVAAECMVALARFVAAQQGLLAQAMLHEQERSGAAWALEWLTLPAMAEATGAALAHGLRLLGAVERIGAPG